MVGGNDNIPVFDRQSTIPSAYTTGAENVLRENTKFGTKVRTPNPIRTTQYQMLNLREFPLQDSIGHVTRTEQFADGLVEAECGRSYFIRRLFQSSIHEQQGPYIRFT